MQFATPHVAVYYDPGVRYVTCPCIAHRQASGHGCRVLCRLVLWLGLLDITQATTCACIRCTLTCFRALSRCTLAWLHALLRCFQTCESVVAMHSSLKAMHSGFLVWECSSRLYLIVVDYCPHQVYLFKKRQWARSVLGLKVHIGQWSLGISLGS